MDSVKSAHVSFMDFSFVIFSSWLASAVRLRNCLNAILHCRCHSSAPHGSGRDHIRMQIADTEKNTVPRNSLTSTLVIKKTCACSMDWGSLRSIHVRSSLCFTLINTGWWSTRVRVREWSIHNDKVVNPLIHTHHYRSDCLLLYISTLATYLHTQGL